MVAAFIWGPMQWRMLHGLAYLHDAQEVDPENEVFLNYMVAMVGILPCQQCREHCTKLFERATSGFSSDIKERGAQYAAFRLHNMVNHKLKRPEIAMEDFKMVQQRSFVWGNEFNAYGFFGFLFVIVLNYDNMLKEERAPQHVKDAYRQLFNALILLFESINMDLLAISMQFCMDFTDEQHLLQLLYREYQSYGFDDDLDSLVERFGHK